MKTNDFIIAEELILGWQQSQDETLFEDALTLCKPLLVAVGNTFRASLDRGEIESALNFGFFEASKAFDGSKGSKWSSFLWLVCKRNLATEYMKSKQVRRRNGDGEIVKPISLQQETTEDGEPLSEVIADPLASTPDEVLMVREDFAEVRDELVGELSDFEAESLDGFLQGLTYKEIAGKLGREGKSIDNSLSRCRLKSRELKAKATKGQPNQTEVPHGKRGKQSASIEDAFWRKVEKREDGCWIWNGIRRAHGVGQLSYQSKLHTALRFAWELHNPGVVLPRKGLERKCGEVWCVNPDHYSLRGCFIESSEGALSPLEAS